MEQTQQEVKHTPGPWSSRAFGTRGEDGPSCFRISGPDGEVADTFGYSERDSANARLIAAAPALLAALKRAKAREPRCLRDQVGASSSGDCNCVTCAIDAAIALAEGRQP